LDPANNIAEYKGNNAIHVCPTIKDTKQFSILFKPLKTSSQVDSAPSCDSINAFVPPSSKFIAGSYPISEVEYSSSTDCIPVEIPPPSGFKFDERTAVSILRSLDAMRLYLLFEMDGLIGT